MKVYSKIIHVMADGTIRDSIEGVVIPLNEKTERFYRLMADLARKQKMLEQVQK